MINEYKELCEFNVTFKKYSEDGEKYFNLIDFRLDASYNSVYTLHCVFVVSSKLNSLLI